MVHPFLGKDLVRPGGRVRILDLGPGEEVPLRAEKSEDALLACLQGTLVLRFGRRDLKIGPGTVLRLARGRFALGAPRGGKALLVVFGLSPGSLAQDHERLLALLEALPTRETAEALARGFEEHIAKEEALYYPTLSPGKLKERLLEHQLLRELLAELLKAIREGRATEGVRQRLKTAFLAHSEAELEGRG